MVCAFKFTWLCYLFIETFDLNFRCFDSNLPGEKAYCGSAGTFRGKGRSGAHRCFTCADILIFDAICVWWRSRTHPTNGALPTNVVVLSLSSLVLVRLDTSSPTTLGLWHLQRSQAWQSTDGLFPSSAPIARRIQWFRTSCPRGWRLKVVMRSRWVIFRKHLIFGWNI